MRKVCLALCALSYSFSCYGNEVIEGIENIKLGESIDDLLYPVIPSDFLGNGSFRGATTVYVKELIEIGLMGAVTIWSLPENLPKPLESFKSSNLFPPLGIYRIRVYIDTFEDKKSCSKSIEKFIPSLKSKYGEYEIHEDAGQVSYFWQSNLKEDPYTINNIRFLMLACHESSGNYGGIIQYEDVGLIKINETIMKMSIKDTL